MFSRNTMPSPDDPFNPKWKLIPRNNMDPPYGALGLVRVLSTEKRSPGTCWLAGNNIAITAAHVVFASRESGASIEVTLHGSQEPIIVDNKYCRIHSGYSPGKYDNDIAILRLETNGRQFLHCNGSHKSVVKVLGFPEREKGRLVESSGNTEQNGVFLLHKADTEDGHSGGPVFDGANGADQQVIALHVAGYDPDYNRALLLRQDLQDFVNSTMVQWS